MKLKAELEEYQKQLLALHFIRFDELPDFGVYNDQVIAIIENQLSFLSATQEERIITPAMINNYVKLTLVDKPEKKKYYKIQIAQLMVITLLKQVLPLSEVKKGMELQVSVRGFQTAYDSFCQELEYAFEMLFRDLDKKEHLTYTLEDIHSENIALKMITLSLASKLLTQKIILVAGISHASQKGENNADEQ
ncbi:Hypothetical protein Tpal_1319 [Trichococcus palustris]|uniref:DUF1836 domain-containing protein n=1 Tax=Trichococcus palustris TaxID=140314 RepID=A0A143YKU6_9LACT|nr:DUF1836 domain-containing protein [Trichococcus palustris]CZQ90852.1 Hypothetical protein Tpal_1319 [Trichococcus palustris]SFL19191.1 protein of unknown function [Trichococcus palustris]